MPAYLGSEKEVEYIDTNPSDNEIKAFLESEALKRYIKRKIRSLVLSRDEYNDILPKLEKRPRVLIWERTKNRLSDLSLSQIQAADIHY